MSSHPFATQAPTLCGPLRQPRQMLAEQKYDGHKSIHDDAMAEGLGLRAGPIPMEMISVLLGATSAESGLSGRKPAVGLFAGQEIRLIKGPLFVDQEYELEREIVALSESARTESVWVKTRVFEGSAARPLVAEMILNGAVMKASYPGYEDDARALGLV